MTSTTVTESATDPIPSMPPFAQLYQLTTGAWVSQAISVAARLGVADAIAGGATTSAEIAARIGVHAPTLYRLLRALTDEGIIAEEPTDHFALTPVGESLRSDVPGSMRGWASWVGARLARDAWSGLEEAIRTGQPAFARVHGTDLFSYLQSHPDAAAIFDAAMKDISGNFLAGILAVYDFSPYSTIADVGGGSGTLLATILQSVPNARGVLLESPEVVASAQAVIKAAGVSERCDVVPGDFFAEVPAGADLYILSNIVHDWADEDALAILRTCRAAMRDDSRLLVIELVLPDDGRPSIGKLVDLEMLAVTPNGRQRTAGQLTKLLTEAGLEMTNVVLALPGTPASYVEAAPTAGRTIA